MENEFPPYIDDEGINYIMVLLIGLPVFAIILYQERKDFKFLKQRFFLRFFSKDLTATIFKLYLLLIISFHIY